jgi:hypothetical protein
MIVLIREWWYFIPDLVVPVFQLKCISELTNA